MAFSDNLRDAIKISGLTTKELAEKTGIKECTISSYLKTNGALPDFIKGYNLARALNVSPAFLATGFEENDSLQSNTVRYKRIINKLSAVPEKDLPSVEHIVSEVCRAYSTSSKDNLKNLE